jgi:outer membrane protein assembly factor BamB/tetratricopeptide (TPR) repeat protein
MDRFYLLWAAGIALACGAAARAAEPDESLSATVLSGEAPAVARRLEAADKLAGKKWADALDDYQRILDEAGDALVPLDPRGATRCVRARWLCHLRIARMPAAARRAYRARVDGPAGRLLRRGEVDRDPRPLRRLLDQAFCSGPAEAALELLGDLAFERGDLDEARRWWRTLARPATEDRERARAEGAGPDELFYPDPAARRVARVRAKQIIARAFQGEAEAAAAELKAFHTRHGGAAGRLAGETGNYAATVARLLDQARGHSLAEDGEGWTTFAGGPARNGQAPQPLSGRIGANGPQWRVRLDTGDKPDRDDRGRDRGSAPALAYHPVLAGNLVLWADARYVNGHDLLTGKRVFRYDVVDDGKVPEGSLGGAFLQGLVPEGVRYTLTAADGRVYARLGAPGLSPRGARGEARNSYLVCLDLRRDAPARQKWLVPSTAGHGPAQPLLFFEGAPLAHGGRVYAALILPETAHTRSWIACYDARTGSPLWRREVCETRAGKEPSLDGRRYRHHLLTLAGVNVVYCSHAGAVVAVDAETGQRAWAVRYPSRGPQTEDGEPSPRGLAPCVSAAGWVFAAPADSDTLFCLDADTGATLWSRDRLEVVHLLGVSGGRLIFTTPRGMRAVSAAAGSDGGGWAQPDDGRLPSFGRGLLAGGWVVWPTAHRALALRTLNAADGSQEKGDESYDPTQFHRIGPGNLALDRGCLAVAGTETLSVYVPEERFLPARRREGQKQDAPAAAIYRLALAEAGAGLGPEALAHLRRAEQAPAEERFRGTPVRELARRERHALLLRLAGRLAAEGRPDEAARRLAEAAGTEFRAAQRLRALGQMAGVWERAGRPARALPAWQAVLRSAALRHGRVDGRRGKPMPAGAFVATRIDELIRCHGRKVYEPIETEAEKRFASARGAGEAEVLEELAREYPNARVTRRALWGLARRHEEAGRFERASWAYRQLLRFGAEGDEAALARAGLARAYERLRCWEAARDVWQQLTDRGGERTVAGLDAHAPVREYAARQLQKTVYRCPHPAAGTFRLPLLRSWPDANGGAAEYGGACGRLLVPAANSCFPADGTPVLFVEELAAHGHLCCREAADGRVRWRRKLEMAPTWAAYHGERLLLGGPSGVCCLTLADGRLAWEFRAPPSPPAEPGRESEGGLSAFRRTRTRLYCLQDECRLLAFDAAAGRVVWAHWAPAAHVLPEYPGGRFNPGYHAGEKWVVVQTGGGKRLVLDSRTGRVIHETAAEAPPWARPPLALDERRVCLVPDADRVTLFDPQSGKERWTYPASGAPYETARTGEAPRIYSDGHVLLVLLARNYGYQWERLDPETGRPVWRERARLVRAPPGAAAVCLRGTAFYYAVRKTLWARSLSGGRLLWSQPLRGAAEAWHVAGCGGTVLAHPADPEALPRWCWISLGGALVPFPLGRRQGKEFAVLCRDARDGRLVQRLNFPGPERGAAVQLLPHGLVVAAGGKTWGLSGAPEQGRARPSP